MRSAPLAQSTRRSPASVARSAPLRTRRAGWLTLAALACACGGGDDHRPAEWAYIHAAIVVPGCASSTCHSAGTAVGGLDFSDPSRTYQRWLEAPYVTPGDPNSPLLYLLEGRERDLMPPSAPLPPVDIELIRRWILEGANP